MGRGAGGGVRRAAVIVGRDLERDRLLHAVDDSRAGGSACIFVVGEGGVGKTRLLAEIADHSRPLGLAVLAGRSPVTTPMAFSVLAQALRSWLRAHVPPRMVAPFDAGLRLVLPEWPGGESEAPSLTDTQLRLLALEGVVRLVREIAETSRGGVLLLDDLHTADPDSLEAIRYLAAAGSPGVVIVGALRSREATQAERVVRALHRDGVAELIELGRLDRQEVTELLGALLDAEPPDELVADVVARTDGVPLLVEEVLDAHLRAGSVEVGEEGLRWRGGTTAVSRTIHDMVQARLARLSSQQVEVMTAGAVLGDFDLSLVAAIALQPLAAVGDAISSGVDVGLLETIGGEMSFRHAVIRDAVLHATLPHILSSLHGRAAAALADGPATDASRLERRAHHLAYEGKHAEAAMLLATASARRLDDHAVLSAEALARAALDLAPVAPAQEAASDALARALAAQGRWADALAVDEATTAEQGETQARWRRMAACAVEAARPDLATSLLGHAVATGDKSPGVDVIAGRLALTTGDADGALRLAERALAAAVVTKDTVTACTALELQGRAFDLAGRRSEAARAWTRQVDEAGAAGLTDARLRAVVLLAKLELFEGRPPQRLYEARDLTRAAGALVEQAWAEENLSTALGLQGDPTAGAQIAADAVRRCRELRLDVLPYLLAAQAGIESYLGGEAVDALLAEADALAPTADMVIHTSGIRADIALRAGLYSQAVGLLETCVDTMRSLPGALPSDAPCWLVWALVAVGRDDDAGEALRYGQAVPNLARWHARPVVLAAAEALMSRSEAGIDEAIASATGRMPFALALIRVLAAEILGGPARVRWLREALDICESAGAEPFAGRVRRLLREAGGPVPRRRRREVGVPAELVEHGVTAREAEVLALLGDGHANSVIAARLYLSVRTVEAHVSSLLAKLHVDSRGKLTALSAALPKLESGTAP